MRPLFLAVLVAFAAVDPESAPVSPDDLMARAEAAETSLAFERALDAYEAVAGHHGTSAHAARAEARAARLRARAEGGFVPLAKLERVRRDPALASDPLAIDRLVADAESFPPGLVRVETWALAAEAYAERLGRPHDAERMHRRVLSDAHADAITARKSARDLVTLLLARGDTAAAADVARADAALVALVGRAVRSRWLRRASIAALAVVLGLALRACVSAARRGRVGVVLAAVRRALPVGAAFAVWVAAIGGVLATRFEGATAAPFVWLAAGLLPLVLLARAWGAAGAGGVSARAARAVLCAAGALAVAFLVVDRTVP